MESPFFIPPYHPADKFKPGSPESDNYYKQMRKTAFSTRTFNFRSFLLDKCIGVLANFKKSEDDIWDVLFGTFNITNIEDELFKNEIINKILDFHNVHPYERFGFLKNMEGINIISELLKAGYIK